MNWDRARQEVLMAAAASDDRLAFAAGGRPDWLREARLESRRAVPRTSTKPARRKTSPAAQGPRKPVSRIDTLKKKVTKARNQGDRKTARALAQQGLAFLTNKGSKNLEYDRKFFREALLWADQRAVGPTVRKPPQQSQRATAKSRPGSPPRRPSDSQKTFRRSDVPVATPSPETKPVTVSNQDASSRVQKRLRLQQRYLNELRAAVTSAGGGISVFANGTVMVMGPTGSTRFSGKKLALNRKKQQELKRCVEERSGLKLDALAWPPPE